jgi:murein DD-endopeptidase MepM/ murein hydrolase activator NlpD
MAVSATACASTPRYPIKDGEPMGAGGFTVSGPKYATDEKAASMQAAPAQSAPVQASVPASTAPVAASPASAPAPIKVASAAPAQSTAVTERPLAAPKPAAPEAEPVPTPPPRNVTVGAGETIYDIAARYHSPVRGIIELNHLAAPYALKAGQRLQVPIQPVYEATDGDTLFGISRRFTVDVHSLASLNDLTLQSRLRLGQRLLLPPGAKDLGSDPNSPSRGATGRVQVPGSTASIAPEPVSRPTASSTASSGVMEPIGSTRPEPLLRPKVRPGRTPQDAISAAKTSPTASALGSPLPTAPQTSSTVATAPPATKGRFVWPVRGNILSNFGPKDTGQRNDGVDIAAELNEPVASADDGEVVYAGSSIPGFGNLVLVKHADGWVTAYAHLAKFAVRIRETVSQGQTIGYVGQTGGADRPQLHFEVRYASDPKDKARPVDPLTVLPK